MARRKSLKPIALAGVRAATIRHLQTKHDRLVGADTEVYDFTLQRDHLSALLEDLYAATATDVYVQRHELPANYRLPRGRAFWLSGDKLVPADDTITSIE